MPPERGPSVRRFPEALRHALAAEYALGTLRGRARRRFEAMAREDRDLAEAVRRWEGFLTPLAARLAPVEPPARVWHAIEARIAPRPAASRPGLWSSLGFWRGVGAGLAAVVVALLALLSLGRPEPAPGPMLVAVLATPESVARMVVEQPQPGRLRVRMVKPWATMANQDLELWVVPRDGKPRSLGVVGHERDSEVFLANLDEKLSEGQALAISMEPRGGSPTGQPTGPVVCSGVIARTRAA